jgi:glutamate dehydrogenase (NAD(P)+)
MTAVNFEKISKYTKIPADAVALLSVPERELKINLNVRLEDGSLQMGNLYLVSYNTARGPAKGGIRFAPDVTMEETADLAERMVWKTALMNIPFGGGKSSVSLDPRKLTRMQKASIMREYVHVLRNELRGFYIPAPDMGTSEWEMAIIFGETHSYESVTGKPVRVGGLPGRLEATGRGLATCVKSAAQHLLKRDVKGLSVAIQGFGNVGSWTARFLSEFGARIVAVSDVGGGIYQESGLPVDQLTQCTLNNGHVTDYAGGTKISNDELLKLGVDILVPAATGHVITKAVAEKIQAKLIVEGANGPTTPEGDEALDSRGIKLVPDILANSGGVIASYIEWRKAKSGSLTRREETFEAVDDLMRDGFVRVMKLAEDKKIPPRLAAEVIAVDEVVGSMKDRGWI